MSALFHDVFISACLLWGMWAFCRVLREDFDRIAKGQRRRKIWSKK